MARQDRSFVGFWGYGLGTLSMLMAAGVVTLFALGTQFHAEPWYDPRYAIPVLGMILGNTMTGVSLAIDRLLSEADTGRARIEARLALGHPELRLPLPLAPAQVPAPARDSPLPAAPPFLARSPSPPLVPRRARARTLLRAPGAALRLAVLRPRPALLLRAASPASPSGRQRRLPLRRRARR